MLGKGGFSPSKRNECYLATKTTQKRLLTYHVFCDQTAVKPNYPFLIFEEQTWTYAQFLACIDKVGNWLMHDLGVGVGEMVAIDRGNSPEYLMLWFALDAIGARISFINCTLTGAGLLHCVRICGAHHLIASAEILDNIEPSRPSIEALGIQIHYFDPQFFCSLTNSAPISESRRESITADSGRGLIYTSGTTGLPNAVIMTTVRELLVGHATAKYLGLRPNDRFFTCLPVYHGSAHALCVTPPQVVMSGATIIQYVGELCRYLLNAPPNEFERKHCVRIVWGNGMRNDVWEPFRQRFGISVINELYGAADGVGTISNRNCGPFTAGAGGLRGAIWEWAYGDHEVRVRTDVDTGKIIRDAEGFAVRCGPGEPRHMLHRLYPETLSGVLRYYNNEEATVYRIITDVFRKGDMWFESGDMMKKDHDGRVYFVNRLGDTFRWKSEKVSTNEVSDTLSKYPHITEANVYGVSIPGYDGRAGAACIVMANGVTEAIFDFPALAQYVRAMLPGYAVLLFLRVTSELEYTGNMKLRKGRLKRVGIDPDLVTGEDKVYWLPPSSSSYLPFEGEDWEVIRQKKVRLTLGCFGREVGLKRKWCS
ncbi:long-chain fatty acid transporter-like protein [Lojkania enalia]|uniref:Long-chain fatty acid transporter-like protein n=1 Tax=Lojkania enalia TaxID=147567 RepID=A0A9P4N6N3_9PLEO|nr:long-chain fatty acid transporter-like protein [Didymosphaeria enalia]